MAAKNTRKRAGMFNKLGYLTDAECAATLGIALKTYANRRGRNDVPPSSKVGATHLTASADLIKWIASRRASRA